MAMVSRSRAPRSRHGSIHKRLVRPFPVALPLAKSYWIVCPKATADLPKLVAFRGWLLAQARDDARALRKQNS